MTTTSPAPSTKRDEQQGLLPAADVLVIQGVIRALHYGPKTTEALAKQIAGIRTDAYLTRLQEIGQALGIEPAELDAAIAERIAGESANAAAGIVQTHNTDFRNAAEKLNTADEIRQWEADRADWKSRQIAFNEYQTARNQADQDFREQNDVRVGGRIVPEDAVCEICQGLIDQGDMTAEELDAVDLPVHINCDHGIEYADDIATALGDRTNVWLGSMIDTAEGA